MLKVISSNIKLLFILIGEIQKKELHNELQVLKEKLTPTESAVLEAANKLKKIQVQNKQILKLKDRAILATLLLSDLFF